MKCRTDDTAVDGKMNTRKKCVGFLCEQTMANRTIYGALEKCKTETMNSDHTAV